MQVRIRIAAGIAAVWAAIALAYATHLFLLHAIYEASPQWRDELVVSALNCGVWVVVVPLIYYAAGRVPFRRGRWISALSFHLPASLIVSLVQLSLHAQLNSMICHEGWYTSAASLTFRSLLARTYSFGVIVYWVVVAAKHVIDDRRSRERLEAELAQARLLKLQSELRPHFLFNTLHSIATLIDEQPRKAQEMIANLSGLLRESLDANDVQEVSLRDELRLLDRSLAIEQVRFADRLTIVRRAADDALDGLVPALLLQPLVENAIRHGFMQRSGAGRIDIDASRVNGSLRLTVRDDGPGIDAGAVGRGRGSRNAAQRLASLYGDRQSIRFTRLDPHGTEVAIELPYRTRT